MTGKAVSMHIKILNALLLLLATNTDLCNGQAKKNSGDDSTMTIIVSVTLVISGLLGVALCSFKKQTASDKTDNIGTSEAAKPDIEIGAGQVTSKNIENAPKNEDANKTEPVNVDEKEKSKSDSDKDKKLAEKSKTAKDEPIKDEKSLKQKSKTGKEVVKDVKNGKEESKIAKDVPKKDKEPEKNKSKSSQNLAVKSNSKSIESKSSSDSLPPATGSKSSSSLPSAIKRAKGPKPAPLKRTGTEEMLSISDLPSTIPTPGSKID